MGVILVASAAASAAVIFSSPAITPARDTTGANFIVIGGNNYDHDPTECTLTDTYNNNWILDTPDNLLSGAVNGTPFFWYCYSPTVGTGHVFTLASTGNMCPNIFMAAFSGMPANGAPEYPYGWSEEGGNYGPVPTTTPEFGNGFQFPISAGDLIITAFGGGSLVGQTVSVDSGVTITAESNPYSVQGIAGGYLIAPQGAVDCTGDIAVSVLTSPATVTVNVASVAPFVAQQTCTGDVTLLTNGSTLTTNNVGIISVTDSTGFTEGMPVYLNHFVDTITAANLNGFFGNVVAVGAGTITVAVTHGLTGFAGNTYSTLTAGPGTVSQLVKLAGFISSGSNGLSNVNGVDISYVISIAPGVLTLAVDGSGLTSGSFTGQGGGGSSQVLNAAGIGVTQMSQIITPQDSNDLLIFLTNMVFATPPVGWVQPTGGGDFYKINSGNTPQSVTTSGDSGFTQNWVNIIASFTSNGSPVNVQNFGIGGGAWGSGTTHLGTSGSSVATGDTIFVKIQYTTPGVNIAPPTISDDHGNYYTRYGLATFDSGSNYSSGCWLFAAQNNSAGIVTVTFLSNCFMSSAVAGCADWSGLTLTSGVVGLPVNPFWSWSGGIISNESGAGMIIFPAPIPPPLALGFTFGGLFGF